MDNDRIELIIEARPIQLIDWMLGEFSVNPVEEPSGIDNSVAVTGTSVSSDDDRSYGLDLMLAINPPSNEERHFTYKCHATAKFVVTDDFDGDDVKARTFILTDGMAELYTLVKAYVFMMTGNSESESVVLPSIVVSKDE